MRLFISKKRLIKTMAEQLAYLQIESDWWYYVCNGDQSRNREMSAFQLDMVTDLRAICSSLDIAQEVYSEAYKIYDFRNSGKKDFIPDVNLIEKLHREFCNPMKKRRQSF